VVTRSVVAGVTPATSAQELESDDGRAEL